MRKGRAAPELGVLVPRLRPGLVCLPTSFWFCLAVWGDWRTVKLCPQDLAATGLASETRMRGGGVKLNFAPSVTSRTVTAGIRQGVGEEQRGHHFYFHARKDIQAPNVSVSFAALSLVLSLDFSFRGGLCFGLIFNCQPSAYFIVLVVSEMGAGLVSWE